MMMDALLPLHVLVVVIFLVCVNTLSLGSQSLSKDGNMIKCIESERRALLLFKQRGGVSDNPDYPYLDSWNKEEEEDCCKWKGVGCNNFTGHVTRLHLSSLLSPTTVSRRYYLEFKISNSLLDLPYLNYLDLRSNVLDFQQFNGSVKNLVYLDLSNVSTEESVFNWIENLPKLQYLNLSFTAMGTIPKFIGFLNNLRYLDLSNNYISDIPNELGNLSKLRYLILSSLNSNMGFPVASVPKYIGSINSLRYLDLSYSGFTGVIPQELGNLSNLEHLSLSSNSFDTSPIPKFIGSLSNLRYLDLSSNRYEGVIPHELGNLSKLKYLNLSANIFGYEFPDMHLSVRNSEWLFNLSSLTHLDMSGVNISSPSILTSFIQRIPSISILRLEKCNLSAPSSTLSNISSSISKLYLQQNYISSTVFNLLSNLSDSLVEVNLNDNVLEGRIPESFGHMVSLAYLNLGHNLLNGSTPNSFGLMTALTYLDLSANQLNGVLPSSLCNLSSLKVADFSYNNIIGSLPDITLLSSLKVLRASSNKLNGYLPTVFEHHSAILYLDLSHNHLRGSIPDFTGFPSLQLLYLNNNEFSGSLPDFTGSSSLQVLCVNQNQLTKWETHSTGLPFSLEKLDLSMNSIGSTISEAHLSNLSRLEYLSTSFNSLTFEFSSDWLPPFQLRRLFLASCKLGPKFPNWIRTQIVISTLDISNSQISDIIPIWFWNFSSDYLFSVNLSSNRFEGKLSCIGVYIVRIDLSSNYLDGPLPQIPAECREINLSRNKFSGTLLSLGIVEDRDFPNVFGPTFLDLSHNQLFGALPDYWTLLPSLGFLNLGYNNFSGRIPTSIGSLVSLETLILRNNKLYGEFPASLRNCSRLAFLDVGLNKLSGELPSWIGEEIPQLSALILKSNRFYGSLPHEICHLSNLHFLDLSMNRISGTIPTCFGNFTAMTRKGKEVVEHIYYSDDPSVKSPSEYSFTYFDDVLARWKGQEYEYGRNFAYLKMIDMSINNLTGEFPVGITRLLELKGLNLSGNRFYGKVPPEVGQLKVLESLDLSTNNFSGEIPPSMSGLNFLAFLNLSYNNFSGKIPSGTQLQGFSTSTYEGNTGLCGKPLKNICPGDEADARVRPPSSEYEVDGYNSEIDKRWLCIGGVLGFSTSFWGIIGILVLNRRWRHAYYLSLYNLKERFHVVMAVRIARLQRNISGED